MYSVLQAKAGLCTTQERNRLFMEEFNLTPIDILWMEIYLHKYIQLIGSLIIYQFCFHNIYKYYSMFVYSIWVVQIHRGYTYSWGVVRGLKHMPKWEKGYFLSRSPLEAARSMPSWTCRHTSCIAWSFSLNDFFSSCWQRSNHNVHIIMCQWKLVVKVWFQCCESTVIQNAVKARPFIHLSMLLYMY